MKNSVFSKVVYFVFAVLLNTNHVSGVGDENNYWKGWKLGDLVILQGLVGKNEEFNGKEGKVISKYGDDHWVVGVTSNDVLELTAQITVPPLSPSSEVGSSEDGGSTAEGIKWMFWGPIGGAVVLVLVIGAFLFIGMKQRCDN